MIDDFNWYVVQAHSGQEEKAKESLLERARFMGCSEMFGEIFIPKMVVERVTKEGERKKSKKLSFPGYILVQMMVNEHTRLAIKRTPKISGFIGNSEAPRPLSDKEVIRLTSSEETPIQRPVAEYARGEIVKVKEGPFMNFDGVVDEVKADKFKLKILVSIFGRETPVELDFKQVEKLK